MMNCLKGVTEAKNTYPDINLVYMGYSMHSKPPLSPSSRILSDQTKRVWLRFLYLMYYAVSYGYSSLTPREIDRVFYYDLSLIPIKSLSRVRELLLTLHKWGYLYRFGEEAWKGYSYMISVSGVNTLYKKGLINDSELSYARDYVLSMLRDIDEKKYQQVIHKMKW